MTWVKSFSELSMLVSFEERFEYLKLGGSVGRATFGFDRYLNQRFYQSREWKDMRSFVISRDDGCDLGVEGYLIHAEILIHHMNPITPDHLAHRDDVILNPDNLITTTQRTHNAIHYGGANPFPKVVAERSPGDTRLWGRRG